ncbi:hypothetical protein D3C85_998840 [compost metagenome]
MAPAQVHLFGDACDGGLFANAECKLLFDGVRDIRGEQGSVTLRRDVLLFAQQVQYIMHDEQDVRLQEQAVLEPQLDRFGRAVAAHDRLQLTNVGAELARLRLLARNMPIRCSGKQTADVGIIEIEMDIEKAIWHRAHIR